MNKLFTIIVIAVTVAGTILPLNSVSAAPQADQAPPDSLWHCVTVQGDECRAEDSNPLVLAGTIAASAIIASAKVICEIQACVTSMDVYVTVSFNFSWSTPYNPPGRIVDMTATVYGGENTTQEMHVDCGSGGSGTCRSTFFFKVRSLSASPSAQEHARIWIRAGGLGIGDIGSLEYSVSVSGQPSPCDQSYSPTECYTPPGGSEIDPNSSAGLSFSTEVDQVYSLNLAGLPESDTGAPDLSVIEISTDGGATWKTPIDLMGENGILCLQMDPDNPANAKLYLTAPTNTFSIRQKETGNPKIRATESKLKGHGLDVAPMMLNFCKEKPVVNIQNCSGQFTVGATVVASGQFAATEDHHMVMASDNVNFQKFEYGQWYVLTTSGGPWQNNAIPPNRYDIQMSSTTSNGVFPSGWQTSDEYSMSNCYAVGGNYISVYFQGSYSGKLWLRVNDIDGVFVDNSGSMSYTITSVDKYEPYAQGCALSYDVNSFIEERQVSAGNNGGIQLLATSDWQWPYWPFGGGGDKPHIERYFVLDTEGVWYQKDSTTPMVMAEMKKDANSWYDLITWPEAVCTQVIDPVGHMRVWFDATKDGTWKFRVHDSDNNVFNNHGQLGYKLYYGLNYNIGDPNTIHDDGYCDKYYTHEITGPTITLYGQGEAGISLPIIAADTVIAIQVSGGPWTNNSVNSYAIAISDDGGNTYTEITGYTGIVCKERSPDDNHPMLYLYGKAGKNYKVRVYDPGGVYTDNAQSIKMIVYTATGTDDINPWHSCANNYNVTEVPLSDSDRTISGALVDGKAITAIKPGGLYALEITGEGPGWGLAGYYSAMASNGDSWEFMEAASWIICAAELTDNVDVADKKRFRIYFTAEGKKTYRLKVNALLGVSTGYIRYRLYKASDTTNIFPPDQWPGDQGVPFEWGGCNVSCQRPFGLFTYSSFGLGTISFGSLGSINFPSVNLPIPNVGGWLDYGRCSIIVYFSWCDSHSAAIENIFASANNKEPFGTISEINQGYHVLIDKMNMLKGQGGETDNATPRSVIFGGPVGGASQDWNGLLNLSTNNPLFGQAFDFTSSMDNVGTGGQPGSTWAAQCEDYARGYIGKAVGGFCWGMAMIHSQKWGMPLLRALQLGCDLILVFSFISYLMQNWVGKGVPA